nr:MAG TPA: hypothetical protein [Caudoviricetes sp.]
MQKLCNGQVQFICGILFHNERVWTGGWLPSLLKNYAPSFQKPMTERAKSGIIITEAM